MPSPTPANGLPATDTTRPNGKHGGQRSGAGRPTKYAPAVAKKILGALRNGCTRSAACAYAEIHISTFANWLHEFAGFAEQVTFAEGKAEVPPHQLHRQSGRNRLRASALRTRGGDEWHERGEVQSEIGLHSTETAVTISPAEVDRRIREVYGIDLSDDEPNDDAARPSVENSNFHTALHQGHAQVACTRHPGEPCSGSRECRRQAA